MCTYILQYIKLILLVVVRLFNVEFAIKQNDANR